MSGRATILYAFEVTGKGTDALKEIAHRIGDVNRNFTGARKGLNQFADWAYEQTDALGTVKEWRDYLLELAGSVHELLSLNKEYARSWEVLGESAKRAGQRLADAVGPRVATLVGNFAIGFEYLATAIPGYLLAVSDFMQSWFQNTYMTAMDSTNAIIKGIRQLLMGNAFDLTPLANAWDDFEALTKNSIEQFAEDMAAAHNKGVSKAADAFKALQGKSGGKAAKPILEVPNEAIAILNTAQSALTDVVPQLEDWGDALITALEEQAGKAGQTMEGVLSVGTGSLSSVLSTVAGPVGALAGSIFDLVKNAPEAIMSIFTEIFDLYVNADEWIGKIGQEVLPMIIRALPIMVAQFGVLVPEIALELIASVPAIVAALVEGIIGMIPAFIHALQQMVTGFIEDIKAAFKPFGKDGSVAGSAQNFGRTVGGVISDVGRLLGVNAPSAAGEGTVLRTGLAVVHKGERISHPNSAYGAQQGGGMRVGAIHITTPDPRLVFQQFRYLQGTGGIGLRADALGGF